MGIIEQVHINNQVYTIAYGGYGIAKVSEKYLIERKDKDGINRSNSVSAT